MSEEHKKRAMMLSLLVVLCISIPFGSGFFIHLKFLSNCEINSECLIDVIEKNGVEGIAGPKVLVTDDICYYSAKGLYDMKKPSSTMRLSSTIKNYLKICKK